MRVLLVEDDLKIAALAFAPGASHAGSVNACSGFFI